MQYRPLLSRISPWCVALGALAGNSLAQAACLDEAQIAAWAQAYEAKAPAPNAEEMSDADGQCTRNKLNAAFEAAGKKPIGYKAGLTNAAVQNAIDAHGSRPAARPVKLRRGAPGRRLAEHGVNQSARPSAETIATDPALAGAAPFVR